MRILTKDGYIAQVGLIFELTDEQLIVIQGNPQFYLEQTFLKTCYEAKGNNAHLFHLGVDNRMFNDPMEILRKFEMLQDEYKSVSWWNREENKFFIKRRELCHKL